MLFRSPRAGIAPVIVVVAIAVAGLGAWLAKPSLFPGAARRAEQSAATTRELISAKDTPAAQNAASATVIGKALQDVPDSPATQFARNEIPIMLARSPAPDPQELLAAERRRVAFMEGRLAEQQALTAAALKDAQSGRERAARAEQAKAASDAALAEAAAAEHARSIQLLGMGAIAFLVFLGWAYARFYSITPASLGAIAADVRAGIDPIHALDTHLAPWLHAAVNKSARLATPPK